MQAFMASPLAAQGFSACYAGRGGGSMRRRRKLFRAIVNPGRPIPHACSNAIAAAPGAAAIVGWRTARARSDWIESEARSRFLYVVAFSAENRYPLFRKML
jgi:hypothetical protein